MNPKLEEIAKSYLRTFIVAALAAFVAAGGDPFTLDAADGRAILVAGLGAVLGPLLRALDPHDSAFGIGSER